MKRKVFFQSSWLYVACFIFEIVLILAFIGSIFCLMFDVFPNIGIPKELLIILFFIDTIIFVRLIVVSAKSKIVFESDHIFVPESGGKGKNKIQYEIKVDYSVITEVFFAESHKDSLNLYDCSALPMPYIALNCIDDKQELINIYWYSRKNRIEIADEIIERARRVGNDFTNKTGKELYDELIDLKKKYEKQIKEERKNRHKK